MADGSPTYHMLDHVEMPFDLGRPDVMSVMIELEPGSAGSPPHRHSGPVFGYLIEGELLFELEGDPERAFAVNIADCLTRRCRRPLAPTNEGEGHGSEEHGEHRSQRRRLSAARNPA